VSLHRGLLHEPTRDGAASPLACHVVHPLRILEPTLRFNSNTVFLTRRVVADVRR
jgi:hypothetical protein